MDLTRLFLILARQSRLIPEVARRGKFFILAKERELSKSRFKTRREYHAGLIERVLRISNSKADKRPAPRTADNGFLSPFLPPRRHAAQSNIKPR
jgi:hypothetical protein